ncbi:MAG TPA: S9 family peptidase [Ilumatobacter sp.]|nr:S9 family peptidase [Ilumatobacter sp.]
MTGTTDSPATPETAGSGASFERSTADIAREHIHLRSSVGQPAVSPNGVHVAAVVATADLEANAVRSQLWLDGHPLTSGPTDSQPTWSPCSRWLAFASRRNDDESMPTLHVMPIDGPGEVRTVCSMPDGLGDIAWSPDGKWFAFTSRTRDERYSAKDESWQSPRKIERFLSRLNGENWVFDRPQHVYVVAADGTGLPKNLTPGEFEFGGVSWLADSSGLVTAGGAHDQWDTDLAEDLYLVSLDGVRQRLTGGTSICAAPAVSPDGAHIAFIGQDDPLTYPQNMHIGIVAVEGGSHRWISADLDRTFFSGSCAQAPVWESATTLLAVAEDRGNVHLFRLHLDGRPPDRILDGPHVVHGYALGGPGTDDLDAAVLATVRSQAHHGTELWVNRGGTDDRVTNISADRLGWEKLAVPCTDGSNDIDVWVMLPPDHDAGGSYPVLLNVHGGPFTQYGESYFDEAQMQASAGFIVVMSNPRGGSGRDTAWSQSILGPKHPSHPGSGWGTVDVDDVVAAIDGALARYPSADANRVGMIGGSYGGYMATMLAARYGDRFQAFCSERAVNNLLTEEYSADIATFFRATHGPNAVDDPDEYLRMSPIRLAHDIHKPMLIIHSENDFRCPINQSEELWITLKLLGRDVTFYRFPSENHEMSRSGSPVHRQMRAEIILDYFRQHLAPH